MGRRFRLAIAAVAACFLMTPAQAADFTLTILHTNDVHSRIEPVSKFDTTCSVEDDEAGDCFGGMARLKTKIEERREAIEAAGGNVLVLDAGDQFQGSLFYTTYKGRVVAELMNSIGYDAMAVGSHEFDDGPETLARFVEEADFPVLAGNIVPNIALSLAGMIEGHAIRTFGDEKVAIVSVVTPQTGKTSAPGPGISFRDEIDYLKEAVRELEKLKIDRIILLSHVGLDRDREIAAAVDGIDVIVGGRSHSLLSNKVNEADGPYPVTVKGPRGQDVPIVHAYAFSKYLGELTVTFDSRGRVTDAAGEPILLDASVKPDRSVSARIAALSGPIETLKRTTIGEAGPGFDEDISACRAGQCAIGTLVADAILDRMKPQGARIAILNAGTVRAGLIPGDLTYGDVLNVVPYQNTLAVFDLPGKAVVAALESGVSQVESKAGRFPQVAGLTYVYDAEKPAGQRIVEVQVSDGRGAYFDIESEGVYRVATTDYLLKGGDGYAVFASNVGNSIAHGPGLAESLMDHVIRFSPLAVAQGQRVVEGSSKTRQTVETEPDPNEGKIVTDVNQGGQSDGSEAGNSNADDANDPDAKPDASSPAANASPLTTAPPKVPAPDGVSESSEPDGEKAEPETATVSDSAPKPVEAAGERIHVIAQGDNFWKLAARYYGNGAEWEKIDNANPGKRQRGLKIGDEIVIPE